MLDSGVHLTTVECAYGERWFECAGTPGVNHVSVRSRTLVWNKEALINIGMSRLPEGWQYMAWLNTDIFFRKPDWAVATVQALQQYDVVQPWSDCYDLGPKDEHLQVHRSFCRIHVHESVPAGIHPNYTAALVQWQERARRAIAGNIGFVPGTIGQRWHGLRTSAATSRAVAF